MQPPMIAVLEDDPAITTLLNDLLSEAGYQVITDDRGADAHDRIRNARPDLIVLDWCLEDREAGGMVLGQLEHDPRTQAIPVIICSAYSRVLQEYQPYLEERGYGVIAKPFDPEALLTMIAELLASRRT